MPSLDTPSPIDPSDSAAPLSTEPPPSLRAVDPPPETGLVFSPTVEDPWLASADLTTFDGMDPDERMRLIIRVLCELVALDEHEIAEADVAPNSVRRLPFLGIEVGAAAKLIRANKARATGAAESDYRAEKAS